MLVSPSNKSLKKFEGSTSNMENPDNLVEKRESIPRKSAVERFQEEPTFALNMLTKEVGFGVWLYQDSWNQIILKSSVGKRGEESRGDQGRASHDKEGPSGDDQLWGADKDGRQT